MLGNDSLTTASGTARGRRPSNALPNADDKRRTLQHHPCFGYIPGPGMPRVHLTYQEFGELATAVGKQLRDVGVNAGDRVAMILNNSVEWAAILLRCKRTRCSIHRHVHTPTRC